MNETKLSYVSKSFRIISGALSKIIVNKTYFACICLDITNKIKKIIPTIGSIESNKPMRIEFQRLDLIKLKERMTKIQKTQMSLLPLEIIKIKGQEVKIINFIKLTFLT